MTGDHSERIADLFAAGSRDLTPASVRHAALLLYAPVSNDPEVTKRCALVLSDTELQRAGRFATQGDKALFKQRRAFRRFCGALALGSSRPLSQIDFEETENGRPHLADLPDFRFSFSSCRFGFLGAWSSTHAIGVDFEDQTKDLEATELAQQFFSGSEANAVEGADGLERLRERGWKIGVATNGSRAQRPKMAAAGLLSHVDGVCVSEEIGVSKPDPGIFAAVAEAAGATLDGGWMAGDSPTSDIGGGRDAGLRTIWISRGREWTTEGFRPNFIAPTIVEAFGHLLAAEGVSPGS